MAVVGLAMVAISGFYLFEYARSGSDAGDFNVVAASPANYLELVGQSIPNPNARAAADEAPLVENVPGAKSRQTSEVSNSPIGKMKSTVQRRFQSRRCCRGSVRVLARRMSRHRSELMRMPMKRC